MPSRLTLFKHGCLALRVIKLILNNFLLATVLIFSLNAISAILPAASIWVGKLIIDNLVFLVNGKAGASLYQVFFYVALEFILLTGSLILQQLIAYVSSRFSMKLEMFLKVLMLKSTEQVPYEKFEQPSFYNKITLTTENVTSSTSSYFNSIVSLTRSLIQLISISYILAKIDIWFLIVVIVINIINLYISTFLSKLQYSLNRDLVNNKRYTDYIFRLLTHIDSIKDIKLFQLSSYFAKQFKKKNKYFIKNTLRLNRKEAIILVIFEILSTCMYYSFYIYIILGVVKRGLTVGDISLYQRSYTTLDSSLSAISTNITYLYESNLYMQHLFELLDEAKIHEHKKHLRMRENEGNELGIITQPIKSLRLVNISFAYPSLPNNFILKNFSCQFHANQSIAIIGENGSGKSTLVKLLCGLFNPSSGKLLLNNKSIDQFGYDEYYQQLSTILQEFNHYDCSLEENIILGDLSAPNRAELFAKTMQESWVNTLEKKFPDGKNTELTRTFSETGVLPSQGEWQKIAFARALYRQANVYIFDEPSAHVDTRYSKHMFNIFQKLKARNNIVIVITHQFDYLKDFDQVLFINKGLLEAIGSHEKLLQENKSYEHLINAVEIV